MMMKPEEMYWFNVLMIMRELIYDNGRTRRDERPVHYADLDILEKLEDRGVLKLKPDPSGLDGYEYEIVNPAFEELYRELENLYQSDGSNASGAVSFDKSSGTLTRRDTSQRLPSNSLELEICQALFNHPARTLLNTDELYEEITGDEWKGKKDAKRLYDAVSRINKKATDSLGIDRLIIATNHTISRNY